MIRLRSVLLILLLSLASGCVSSGHTNDIDLIIDGSVVDNGYNNYVAGGELARAGNDLYLVSYDSHGFIISSNQSRTIKTTLANFLFYRETELEELYENEGIIYKGSWRFSNEKGYFEINDLSRYGRLERIVGDNVYISKDKGYGDVPFGEKLRDLYLNGKLIIEDYEKCYITEEAVFFIADIDKKKGVYKCNLESEDYTLVWPEHRIKQFMIYEDKLIYILDETYVDYLKVSVYDMLEDEFSFIESEKLAPISFNVYSNNLYFSDGRAIYKYSLSTCELIFKFEDEDILKHLTTMVNCYIVDDKWLYFTTVSWNHELDREVVNLYRIMQDGGFTEVVLENVE